MLNERIEKQLNFILELDKLKLVIRRNRLLDESRNENTAEHTWHAIMGALVLAEYRKPGTDLFRIVQLIAVHDIVEIYAGDTFFYSAEGYETKKQREEEAIAQLVALLPADQAETFAALWYEFETNETPDANFANAVDQLMPALLNSRNNGLSWTENNIAKTQVEQKMHTVTQASETLSDILKDAIARSVEKGLLS